MYTGHSRALYAKSFSHAVKFDVITLEVQSAHIGTWGYSTLAQLIAYPAGGLPEGWTLLKKTWPRGRDVDAMNELFTLVKRDLGKYAGILATIDL